MNKKIEVFQDENATYTFIIGTDDVKEAEAALREMERVWYGEDESNWNPENMEKSMDFAAFDRQTFYISGEKIFLSKEEAEGVKGPLAVREGFMAPID